MRDFSRDGVKGLLHDLVAGVHISGQNPGILDVVNAWETHARVDDCVAVVVGLDHLVVALGDESSELDIEVALVLRWVSNGGLADAATPLGCVIFPLVVDDANATVVIEGVLSGVADAFGLLVDAVLVTACLVPEAEVAVQVEVLLDLRLLAGAESISSLD